MRIGRVVTKKVGERGWIPQEGLEASGGSRVPEERQAPGGGRPEKNGDTYIERTEAPAAPGRLASHRCVYGTYEPLAPSPVYDPAATRPTWPSSGGMSQCFPKPRPFQR